MNQILMTPFTGLGLFKGYRGDKWLKNRIRIFKQFVLPSLLNQSKKEFINWITWRPEEKENPIVQEFMTYLDKIDGLRFIHTFHGLCFWDDKYDDITAKQRLMSALDKSIPELEQYIGSEWVALTIQPSDDMYISDMVERIQKEKPEYNKAIGYTKGYVMDISTKEVGEWTPPFPKSCPPFYTIFMPSKTFLSPRLHLEYYKDYKSHEDIPRVFDFKPIHERGFMVGTHGDNISTVFAHPFMTDSFDTWRCQKTWLLFGIYNSDPIVTRKGWRLWLRIIANKLPHSWSDKLREWYHKR